MQPWESYKLIKLQRGELIDRIKNYQQSDWIKVCEKLEIIVSTEYGRGDHAVAYKDNCSPEKRECVVATLVRGMHSGIQRDIFKKILCYGVESGKFNEDDIWKAMKVKF